jgi:ribonuclease R
MLDKDQKTLEKYKHLSDKVFLMEELADILIAKREKDGSVDLDVKESTITVDKKGEIFVEATKKDKAHGLIEEFMILANCTVAEYMYFLEKPFIYRVHGQPTEERLENFYDFLKGVGINVKRKKEGVYPKDFQLIEEKKQREAAEE